MFVNDLELANIPNDITNMIVTQYLSHDFKSLGKLSITSKKNHSIMNVYNKKLFLERYQKIVYQNSYFEKILWLNKPNLAFFIHQFEVENTPVKNNKSKKNDSKYSIKN